MSEASQDGRSTPVSERPSRGKLAIRVVPYSPPRPESQQDEWQDSQASGSKARQAWSGGHPGDAAKAREVGERRQDGKRESSQGVEGSDPGSASASAPACASACASASASASASYLSSRLGRAALAGKARDQTVSGTKPLRAHGYGQLESTSQPGPAQRPSSEVSSAPSTIRSSPSPISRVQPAPVPSRRRNLVTINADKTFTIVRSGPERERPKGDHERWRSADLSHASRTPTTSTYGRPSTAAWTDELSSHPSSPLTGATTPSLDRQAYSQADLSLYTPSPSSSNPSHFFPPSDARPTSPGFYPSLGSVRKVRQDQLRRQESSITLAPATESPSTRSLALPEFATGQDQDEEQNIHDGRAEDLHDLLLPQEACPSSGSGQTTSRSGSDRTNYKVYSQDAPGESSDSLAPHPDAASQSNWEVIAGSSAPDSPTAEDAEAAEAAAVAAESPIDSIQSAENYVVHGGTSPSSSASAPSVRRLPSLPHSAHFPTLPCPKPVRDQLREQGLPPERSHSRQESQKSVQGAASVRSIASFTSEDGQDRTQAAQAAQAVFVNPVIVDLRGRRGSARVAQQNPWSSLQTAASSSAPGPSASGPSPSTRPSHRPEMVEAYPHQWSSQLSTVPSLSEEDSELYSHLNESPTASASGSGSGSGSGTGTGTGPGAREHGPWPDSTGWASSNSRHLLSISPSLAAQLLEDPNSNLGSLTSPRSAYARGHQPHVRMIRDPDEHGDGLADLDHRPSRTGLSALFSSSNGSSRNLHSSAGSISSSIPTWARLYYGSGERKFLQHASISTFSEIDDSSRPGSACVRGSDSPDTAHFPLSIYSPRRRPRESGLRIEQALPVSVSTPTENAQLDPVSHRGVIQTIRKKTSSIWSPHLRRDRRASAYSAWDPPTVTWSADGGIKGRRNTQVVLFVLGFLLPAVWMVAAFLPLPPNPKAPKPREDGDGDGNGDETDASTSRTHFSRHPEMVQRIEAIDEFRYESARWWRNVNRIMTVIGLLIIAFVITLIITGLKQGWIATTVSSRRHI